MDDILYTLDATATAPVEYRQRGLYDGHLFRTMIRTKRRWYGCLVEVIHGHPDGREYVERSRHTTLTGAQRAKAAAIANAKTDLMLILVNPEHNVV